MPPQLCAMTDSSGFDVLDDCVEAQVHGSVLFGDDAAAAVLDPVFEGSPIKAAARRLGRPVRYGPGFRVCTSILDPSYRGVEFVELAQSLGES